MSVALLLTTPGLLAGAMVLWVALFGAGVPSFACSLVGLTVVTAGMLALERYASRPGLDARPAGTLVSDVSFTATTAVVAIFLPSFVSVPLGRAAGVALGTASIWPARLPFVPAIVACVVLADFTSYWWHRLQHTTGDSWLWRIHSVHHSPRHFDYWMGGRVHPFDTFGFTLVTYAFLAFVGAPIPAIAAAAFFAAMVGAIHHSGADSDCRAINRLVPFADHHIVHHSLYPHDAGNYGNITTLFDTLFGTYRAPTPRNAAPCGAHSLSPDYPQGDYVFQMASPFGRWWRRATAPARARPRAADDDRPLAVVD
jgi:sterol desaturase/sphingolipid hydroxylase (fatty acid hydroxylase superfamily)